MYIKIMQNTDFSPLSSFVFRIKDHSKSINYFKVWI